MLNNEIRSWKCRKHCGIKALKTAGLPFVKGADERDKFFEKNKQSIIMTNKCRQTRQRTNKFRDELIWGMNSASELATVYYYTCRSISSSSQSTPPGDKAWCTIAPIERYSGYRHFQWKKKKVAMIDALILFIFIHCYSYTQIIYLSAIKRLTCICGREMSLIGSTFFSFAQNKMHDFQNTLMNSYIVALSSTNATKRSKC